MLEEFWEILLVESPLAPPPPHFLPHSGGLIDFYGVVRGTEATKSISGIRYESNFAMAEHQLEKLGVSAAQKFAINGLLIHHRLGIVPVAEPSLFLRVSAKHRRPAFEATEWIITELKLVVPIWKHAIYPNVGGAEVIPSTSLRVNQT